MLSSAAASESLLPTSEDNDYLITRRIRHITGVHIRNLTPFPVRDSFTSALSLPLEQTHLGASGITDDLASIPVKKRTRKTSTNSSATRRSLKHEDGVLDADIPSPVELKGTGTVASSSTAVSPNGKNTATSPGKGQFPSHRLAHSLRGRRRTSSITSFSSTHSTVLAIQSNAPPTALTTASFLPDHSQAALQSVIDSRLVETFLIIKLPSRVYRLFDPSQGNVKSLGFSPMKESTLSNFPIYNRHSVSLQHGSPPRTGSQSSRSGSAPLSRISFEVSIGSESGHTLQTASRLASDSSKSAPPSQHRDQLAATSLAGVQQILENGPDPVIYFSPIHRPSTNPFFPIDAKSGSDLPRGVETSGQVLKVEIWGRIPAAAKVEHGQPARVHSSQEERQPRPRGWKMLEAWDVDLSELLPLPENIDANPSVIPSNSLLITLSPPGRVYYLPHPSTSSRPSTPSVGYTSDPESEIWKAKKFKEGSGIGDHEISPLSRRRRRKRFLSTATSTAKTASLQELFKLVTIQSLILDNETSLGEIIHKIDGFLAKDDAFHLKREMSERQARIQHLEQENQILREHVQRRRREIQDRSERLRRRSELLTLARLEIERQPVIDTILEKERQLLNTLRDKTRFIRTSLFSTLSTIFPIELCSAPDLLFTILDVPLPIPLTATNPAPPLTLFEHKQVTEESVATALGYVAQILQILAAYLSKPLVYPVTCIGSRSLIRDGISAMVGPRMFPLFSKGVDTYRFEYGVFLLNKNIEMFMLERDLRALDIRHTLPNLKNLLLTLSHDSDPKSHSVKDSVSCVDSGFKTPSRESSPMPEDASTPKAKALHIYENATEGVTPTASGATTPTTATMSDDTRKSKSFLGFVPFGEFIWPRYPSTSQSADKGASKVLPSKLSKLEAYPESDDATEGADADDDDRTTIHDIVLDKGLGPSDDESSRGVASP